MRQFREPQGREVGGDYNRLGAFGKGGLWGLHPFESLLKGDSWVLHPFESLLKWGAVGMLPI